jgi:hypothetical protein
VHKVLGCESDMAAELGFGLAGFWIGFSGARVLKRGIIVIKKIHCHLMV